ncbi:type VII secretion protein EccB [Mycobacterium sp. IS-1556]|uniref:type VII secretion protein EccB n=1 Tax=Mycobacterium sp. IS-1556 TaxID=1772276 RepID=UPI0025702D97|nr:type VII secretion protein EccB [Mycobacterium sp. IS-1556]
MIRCCAGRGGGRPARNPLPPRPSPSAHFPCGHAPPVQLAQADAAGAEIDGFSMGEGRSAYVRAVGVSGDGARNGTLYLVNDAGVVFGIREEETAERLGLTGEPVPAPWPLLARLPRGPELSVAAASRAGRPESSVPLTRQRRCDLEDWIDYAAAEVTDFLCPASRPGQSPSRGVYGSGSYRRVWQEAALCSGFKTRAWRKLRAQVICETHLLAATPGCVRITTNGRPRHPTLTTTRPNDGPLKPEWRLRTLQRKSRQQENHHTA